MARPRLVGLALALVTLLVYLPVRHHGFIVYDDPDYLTENRIVQAGLSWSGLHWAFTTAHADNWHPLTWLSHMLDCTLFGLEPGAHHLVNVLFHTANALLLLLVLYRLTGALWPCAWTAALFAWHPLHIQSVAWAAERKDVLSTFFGLLALWGYSRYVSAAPGPGLSAQGRRAVTESQPPPASIAAPLRCPAYWLVLLCFALSLLAKPMLVTLPFVLLLLDYWPLNRLAAERSPVPQRAWARLAAEKWPLFVLSAAACVVTFLAQRAQAVVALAPYPLSARVGNALVSYVRYLLKTLWPVKLAIIYPLPPAWPWTTALAAFLVLLGISLCVWRLRRQRPYLLVGWLWFLGTLVPVIGLVQVGGQAMADRYTYLPLVGLFLGLAFEVQQWVVRRRLGVRLPALLAGLTLAGCLAVTAQQLRFWHDSQTLFNRALAVTTNNAVAEANLGMALEQQGQWEAALAHYLTALRLNPDLAAVHNDAANVLRQLGKPAEALGHYREGLRLTPQAPLLHINFGSLLLKQGQFEEALRHYQTAAQLSPADPRPHYLTGKALLRQGQAAAALPHFREALRRDPNDIQTLTCLARTLGADTDPAVRNGTQAVALAEQANALTGGNQSYVLDTLAMAYAEAGRFQEAQQTLQTAISQVAATEDKEVLSALQARLRLYAARQPYREAFTNSP